MCCTGTRWTPNWPSFSRCSNALSISDAKLITTVLKVVRFHDYPSKPAMIAQIHAVIHASSDPLMADVALGLL